MFFSWLAKGGGGDGGDDDEDGRDEDDNNDNDDRSWQQRWLDERLAAASWVGGGVGRDFCGRFRL